MAAQSNQAVTLVPAQPTTLLVGDRRIPVDDWPLAQTVDENRSIQVAASDDQLVIEPKRRSAADQVVGFTAMFLCAGAFPSLVVGLFGLPLWLAVLMSVVVLVLLVLFARSSLSSMKWTTFDRQAHQLVFERRVGFRNQRRIESTYPLETVRAVQLLHSGHRSVSETQRRRRPAMDFASRIRRLRAQLGSRRRGGPPIESRESFRLAVDPRDGRPDRPVP